MYLDVGCNLGGIEADNEFKCEYLIELHTGNVVLDFSEFVAWFNYKVYKQNFQITLTKKLVEKGVFIEYFDTDDLFESIANHRLMRQGFSYRDFRKTLPNIITADDEDFFAIKDETISVWREANGIKTVTEVYEKFSDMSLDDYTDIIIYLRNHGLIWII